MAEREGVPGLAISECLVEPEVFEATLQCLGVAALRLHPGNLENDMLEIAWSLGQALPETGIGTPPSAIYEDVILRIHDRYDVTHPEKVSTFSGAAIDMHIDQGSQDLTRRPLYVGMGCVVPPEPGSGSQTMLSDARDLVRYLTEPQETLLRHAWQINANGEEAPTPVLSTLKGRPALAFGPGDRNLKVKTDLDVSEGEITDAVNALYEGLHQHARAIVWEPGLLVTWVNPWYAHARLGRIPAERPSARSLRRFRTRPMVTL